MNKIITLLLCVVVCNSTQAQIDKKTIDKLETTAKKIRVAGLFLSDDDIKKRIKVSMLKEQEKWKQARRDYQNVLRQLRQLGVDVNVPPTLDKLLIEHKPKDANKILMFLAKEVKQHLVS